jgi:hypothetical protein
MLISKTSSGRGELEKLLAVRIEMLRAGVALLEIRVLSAMVIVIVDRELVWLLQDARLILVFYEEK